MRIIHDVEWSTKSIVCCEPYGKADTDKFSSGIKTAITVCVCAPYEESFEDTIEIEGDGACILQALEDICEKLRDVGDMYVKEGRISRDWRSHATKLSDEWRRWANQKHGKRRRRNRPSRSRKKAVNAEPKRRWWAPGSKRAPKDQEKKAKAATHEADKP